MRSLCHPAPMALLPDLLPAGPVELRRWHGGHAEQLRASVSASFAELHAWVPWAAEPPTADGMRDVVTAGVTAFDADRDWTYVVGRPGRDEVLGSAGLHSRGPSRTVEIGYWIRTDATGRGYATAAARALTTAAFEHLVDVDRTEIWVDVANVRSDAVPGRLGYRVDREVDRTADAPAQNGRRRVHVMERLRWSG